MDTSAVGKELFLTCQGRLEAAVFLQSAEAFPVVILCYLGTLVLEQR